jgi:hypothetical protein
MPRTADLREAVEAADEIADVLTSCWDGFEFIQQASNRYAMPGTRRYHAFMFAMTAACLGRDVLGFAPSIPGDSEQAAVELPPADLTPDDVAEEISALASAMHGKLTVAADGCWDSPADQRAFLAAAESAAEIRDLLSGP